MWRVCRRTLGKKLIDLTLATLGLKNLLNWSQIEGKTQKNSPIFGRWTAQPRCRVVRPGASRAKIETSWSLRLKGVKRLYEMNVTVETIRTNIRIPCLRVSCPFGGVARVARERGHDCQRRRGESRSLARSFAASLAIIRELDRRLIMPPGFTHLCRICHCLLYFLGRCNSRRNTWL